MIKTTTLGELAEAIKEAILDHGADAKAVFASNYGDRSRTQQAHAIRGRIEEVSLSESGYSESGFSIDDDDEMTDSDETFVVIK